MINKAILIIFIFVAFAACDNEPEFTKVKVENIDKSRAYRNTFLPDELKSRILDGVKSASAAKAAAEHGEKKSEHGEKKEEGHGEEKKEEGHGEKKEEHGEKKAEHGAETPAEQKLSEVSGDGYARMRVNVYLVEKTQGVLKHNNYKFDYGPGGGELDLADYVDDRRKGTFYLAFQPDPLEEGELSVWYLSNARLRKLGGDTVGGGCKTFFDITNFYKKEMKDKGFTVNTTDQRYVSALAGQYFLRVKKEGRVAITTIDVLDSRYKNLLCR